MDDKWFKQKQKIAGVTAEDIAEKLGRDRSVVSRIYTGRQPMRLEEARVFSTVLDVPLSDVLEKAGIDLDGDLTQATQTPRALYDGEAAPYFAAPSENEATSRLAASFGGGKPGIDVWRVNGNSLALRGYMPGDFALVDSRSPNEAQQGDAVVAQVFDPKRGAASTVFRLFEPPFLLCVDPAMVQAKPLIVDGDAVAIRGRVIASWRT